MDGFALRAVDMEGATLTRPRTLKTGEATVYVDTGDPLPGWANVVIPIENTEALDGQGNITDNIRNPSAIRIREALPPWKHVRAMGEDMVATQLVLPAGHVLRPVDLGGIAGSGHDAVWVSEKPHVAIIPTGTELKPIGQPVGTGDIIEYNSLVLAAQVEDWGGQANRFPIVPDDFDAILNEVRRAAEDHDLILLNAGSSAGSEDYSARIVENLGQLLVHGVAVRPGHPVIIGLIQTDPEARPVPIIGVPGYPVSSALTGEIFVEPLLARWTGRPPFKPQHIAASITRKTASPGGDDDYVRVAVGRVNERLLATPISRGAGVISSLVRADGIVIVPRGSQGLEAGADVQVRLYRTPAEIERTILVIGSHDITLDLMAQHLAERQRRLTSANVGSLGGLVALRRGEAHLAGSHLLDVETGEYNLSYLEQYLPGIDVMVVALVGREQGLLIPGGNPKQITSLDDLRRDDVRIINRQRGAGTRVLLEYELGNAGIEPENVHGFDQEEYTHLAVAAAVASGRADCGLGIAAAAVALRLDFVPLFKERYDLIIPRQHYESPLLSPLLELLDDHSFKTAVSQLPGYDVSVMGRLIAEVSAGTAQ
jgi:putative molybdopterin biosynthesis protein